MHRFPVWVHSAWPWYEGQTIFHTGDNDIRSMYDEYQGRIREIIMWMKICKHFHSKSTTDVGSRKRQSSVDNVEGSSSMRLKSGVSEQRRAAWLKVSGSSIKNEQSRGNNTRP